MNIVIELENKIKEVKQKIEDVKSFKNFKLFSEVKYGSLSAIVVYDPGTL